MTSLLNRITTALKGKAHDAMDSVEDVGSIARQSVRELEENIGKIENALVDVQAQRGLLSNSLEKARGKVVEFQNYAQKAVQKGDDKLAKDAIQDRQTAEHEVADLQRQYDSFNPTVESLEGKLADLTARRDQMNRDASMIEARSVTAKATSSAADLLGSIGDGSSASKTFDRLNEKVEREEAEAKARLNMADAKKASDPATKYASLDAVGGPSIDDELAKLKASLNK